MASRLELNFSKTFNGIIWNTVTVPGQPVLILEIRDELSRQVMFSAVQYQRNIFLWENLTFEESWWISVLAAGQGVVLFQTFDDMQDPQQKTLTAMDLNSKNVLWERSDFSYHGMVNGIIKGMSGVEEPKPAMLELLTGQIIGHESQIDQPADKISSTFLPFQYLEGSTHFETIKKFAYQKFDIHVIRGAEYLEHAGLIGISYYTKEDTGLTNYLVIMNEHGDLLLKDKLGEALKGLGIETFFILEGCLFFVRNKREFLSYRII